MGDRSGLTRLDRTNGYDDGRAYMKVKKSKLAQQNDQIREALRNRNSSMRTELFKGISINVNGRTQPTADELKRLILLNGGDYHPYYRYQTTKFMIATNLSMARVKQLRPDDRVIRPEWITDSIKAKCLLPYEDYQLFADEAKDEGTKNNTIQLAICNKPTTSKQVTTNNNNNNNTSSDNKNNKHTTRTVIPTDKKKPLTMADFVIRGVKKPTRFSTPNVRDQKTCVANICGLTDINGIIRLLNEWVGCPEGITDEDTACVTKYFYDLMSEKDYHNKFYEVIDALQQRISQHGERSWVNLYNDLVRTLKKELTQNTEASQNLSQLITSIDESTDIPASSQIDSKEVKSPLLIILDDDVD